MLIDPNLLLPNFYDQIKKKKKKLLATSLCQFFDIFLFIFFKNKIKGFFSFSFFSLSILEINRQFLAEIFYFLFLKRQKIIFDDYDATLLITKPKFKIQNFFFLRSLILKHVVISFKKK